MEIINDEQYADDIPSIACLYRNPIQDSIQQIDHPRILRILSNKTFSNETLDQLKQFLSLCDQVKFETQLSQNPKTGSSKRRLRL